MLYKVRKSIPIAIRFALATLILMFSLVIYAQTEGQNNALLKSSFIKPTIDSKSGQLSFNVVKVVNTSQQPIKIKPIINVPKGISLFNENFKDTTINAMDSILLPFRLKVTNEASSQKKHEVIFQAFDMNYKLILENILYVSPEVVHNWEVNIPNNRAYFYPRFNMAEFEIHVKNKGNTPELVTLNIRPDRELRLKSLTGEMVQSDQNVLLGPNQDTIIKFQANYTQNNDRIFDISKVHINASANNEQVYRSILIEKYTDEYSPLFVDNTLPHSVELGVRSSDFTDRYTYFLNARGNTNYKNESNFRYYYSNFDLRETDNFIHNSNYQFLYSWNGLEAGVGAFSSQLGRNLFSRNSIMLGYTKQVGPEHNIRGFASQDYLDPITNAGFGHTFNNEKYNLTTTGGVSFDGLRKVNTISLYMKSTLIPLYKSHSLSVFLNGFREEYYLANRFVQQGFGWDLSYFGKLGSRISYRIRNNYGSPDIPGHQRGLLGFSGKLTYVMLNPRNFITIEAYDTRRNYYNYDMLGDRTPNSFLHDTYGNVLYNSHQNTKFTWSIGPSVEFYESERPKYGNNQFEYYDFQKFLIEIKSHLTNGLRIQMTGGIRDIYYQGISTIDETKPDFHLIADYSYKGYGVRFNYNYGPLVRQGIYQFATDMDYNGFMISPNIVHSFNDNRVKLQLFSNITYRFDLKYAYANISPKVEVYLARNWYVNVGGAYSYFRQNNDEYISDNSIYYAEFSIKKKWGKTDFYNQEKRLRRLKVVCFKDENNNGRKDKYEEGIEMVKIRLHVVNETNQPDHIGLPVDISLLTNEKGSVIFNRIPKGFFELDVNPLTNLGEYFYVSDEHEYVQLTKNMTYFIPFQKANRIEGRIDIKRAQYTNERKLDLENIKVTAYNGQENSYSSFTRVDGTFTIYAPGDTTYYLRMENVFGSAFRILKNDIPKKVPDSTNTPVVFNIVEGGKKINFKKVKKATPGTSTNKIKVLKGKIYEKTDEKGVDEDALPGFDLKLDDSIEIGMSKGKSYLIFDEKATKDEAIKTVAILKENGVDAYISFNSEKETYYVCSSEYNNRSEAQNSLKELKKKNQIKIARILNY